MSVSLCGFLSTAFPSSFLSERHEKAQEQREGERDAQRVIDNRSADLCMIFTLIHAPLYKYMHRCMICMCVCSLYALSVLDTHCLSVCMSVCLTHLDQALEELLSSSRAALVQELCARCRQGQQERRGDGAIAVPTPTAWAAFRICLF